MACSTVQINNKPDLTILKSVPAWPVFKEEQSDVEFFKLLTSYTIKLQNHARALHEYLRFLADDKEKEGPE